MERITRHDRFALRALVAVVLGMLLWLVRPKRARATVAGPMFRNERDNWRARAL